MIPSDPASRYLRHSINAILRDMIGSSLIREARRRARLTQKVLAAKLGTTQSAIARWENGAVSPRVDTLDRMLRACGFESRVLLTRALEPDLDQLVERLAWTPKQRLDYLRDMLAFEQRAHRARRAVHRR